MRTKPVAANTVNWRNRALRYRELLLLACRALEKYPKLMPPGLQVWWIRQKPLPVKPNQQEIDAAAIAKILADNSDLSDTGGW